ncbi:MAG TPA: sodium:proton antiporter [Steroidobacteraceae bacterium]|nr:sodium:proton antiporter [Steroidobacteraceae bacterium]
MEVFQWVLVLLVGAVGLTALARRINVPYPSLLAIAGVALALLPGAPRFQLDPALTLALFVAPVLLDAAYDTSIRDLRANWIPVTSLALAAVGITTAAVAWTAHTLVPEMPWAAAIALGAIVAPPDAAAATAVLRQLHLPHRLMVILEGESLLNDASALLIYRLAVMAVASGGLELGTVVPISVLAIAGSLIVGYLLARLYLRVAVGVTDVPSSIVLQFAGTFGVWILAEHLHLSAIVTVVVFGISIARDAPRLIPARSRIQSYAVWDLAVFVLNVLAFVLIGLQLRPILTPLEPAQRLAYFAVAAVVLGIVIAARFVWVFSYSAIARLKLRWAASAQKPGAAKPTVRASLVVSWCGMRGIVTLAAAYALPSGFPHRDLIVLTAFCVVVGTLVVQGLTLRPLILLLKLQDDDTVSQEVDTACERLVRAGLEVLDGDHSQEAKVVRRELEAQLTERTEGGQDSNGLGRYDSLRARIVAAQRQTLLEMRSNGEIGDDAFHQVEAQLDVAEVNAEGAQYP